MGRSRDPLLQKAHSTERINGITREISGKHIRFCSGPVNSLWSNMSSGVAAQNILISRVSIQKRYLLLCSRISPLVTIRTFRIQQIKSYRIILKTLHKALWLPAQGMVVAGAMHSGWNQIEVFPPLRLWSAASLTAQQFLSFFFFPVAGIL